MDARTNEASLESGQDYFDGSEYSAGTRARPSMGVMDILETLRRNWRFPLYGFLIGCALAAAYVLSASIPYKSSARILVDRSVNRYLQNNKIADQPTLDESEISSQIYVLSSDSVVVPVVRSLGLARDREFAGLPKMGGARISDYIGDLKKLIGLGPNADETSDPEAVMERKATEALVKRLTVTREDIANVINVAVESEDKIKAAKIANALADTYISSSMEARLKSTKVASQWLQERLTELKRQLADADRTLEDFRLSSNLKAGTGGQTNELRASLNTQLTNAQIATAEAKSRLDRIQNKSGDEIMTFVETDAMLNP
ncbi:MAG: Wzz/FepE/Etk N-terminal domain-containing protein, partial [Bradyrhizobium sp.]